MSFSYRQKFFSLTALTVIVFCFNAWAEPFQKDDELQRTSPRQNMSPQKSKKRMGGIRGLYDPKKRRYSRYLASIKKQRTPHWFLGVTSHFDGPFASVDSASRMSRGLGYSGGLNVEYHMPYFKFGFEPSYEYLRLGRTIDGSGIYQDVTTSQVTQTNRYLGLAGYGSFLIEQGGGLENPWDPAWWGDFGTELLLPLSSLQTSTFAEDVNLKADKLWLVLIGGTLDFNVANNYMFRTRLHFFYNLPSTSQGRLFGVRAQIAFNMGLL